MGRDQHPALAGLSDRHILIGSPLASIIEIVVLVGAFIAAEAIARRRLLSLLASALLLAATIALIVGFLLLVHKHWRIAISALLGGAALALLVGNLRALRRR